MSIFDRDRIGVSIFCKVTDGDSFAYGYVKWILAIEGEVVDSIENANGSGIIKGPWTVVEVDVSVITTAY